MGKKVVQEAIVLATCSVKGNQITPILSLRPTLVETARKSDEEQANDSRPTLIPTQKTSLYMGAYVQGYCARIDRRYGAFIRFLDNLTGIVPKLRGGLNMRLHETVLCKVVALDVMSDKAPKILLKQVKSDRKPDATKSEKKPFQISPTRSPLVISWVMLRVTM